MGQAGERGRPFLPSLRGKKKQSCPGATGEMLGGARPFTRSKKRKEEDGEGSNIAIKKKRKSYLPLMFTKGPPEAARDEPGGLVDQKGRKGDVHDLTPEKKREKKEEHKKGLCQDGCEGKEESTLRKGLPHSGDRRHTKTKKNAVKKPSRRGTTHQERGHIVHFLGGEGRIQGGIS